MSSISYAGHDFSPYVSAELVEGPAHAVEPVACQVPGRPGAVILRGDVAPRPLRVRLFADLRVAESLPSVRRRLRSWLLEPMGADLAVPGEPGLTWRDCVVTGMRGWSGLFPEGSCEVTFEAFDPIAYGERVTQAGDVIEVGGTWRTWPTWRLVAEEADACSVTDLTAGTAIVVGGPLSAGDVVVVDALADAVSVNGQDASARVSMGSDLAPLWPGTHELRFTGCSSHEASWTERWA